jgi:hypothetical protein
MSFLLSVWPSPNSARHNQSKAVGTSMRELRIHVRISAEHGAGSGQTCASERATSRGDLFQFVRCKLTSTHPAEYAVIVAVRHRFLLCASHFLLQIRWKSTVEKNVDQKRLQNKHGLFNKALRILSRNKNHHTHCLFRMIISSPFEDLPLW